MVYGGVNNFVDGFTAPAPPDSDGRGVVIALAALCGLAIVFIIGLRLGARQRAAPT